MGGSLDANLSRLSQTRSTASTEVPRDHKPDTRYGTYLGYYPSFRAIQDATTRFEAGWLSNGSGWVLGA
jgi:hypothetical protein